MLNAGQQDTWSPIPLYGAGSAGFVRMTGPGAPLVYLRKHDTLEQIAAGSGIGTATAWRYVNHTIEQLALHAPSLTEALTSHHADGYVLLDSTVAETDRVQARGHFTLLRQSPP